jgi:predicted transcriptional regulator
MYKAFLSFAQLREYLIMLLDNRLIEYEDGKHTYRTAEKGMKLLEVCEKMYELVPPLALPTTGNYRLATVRGY